MPQNQSSKKPRVSTEQRARKRTQVILLVLSALLILSMVVSLVSQLQ
jgi:predicted nucleic acid-binding Zn ribbon protein